MPVIATDTLRYSNLVKYEHDPKNEHCRDAVIANEAGVKTYAVGTVLGTVTATGKYLISVQTAVDGSAVPSAIVLDDYSIAAATDTVVKVLKRGPAGVSKSALILDASHNTAPELAAVYAAIEALGIKVLDAI